MAADAWRIGGATMWGWFSYDPDLDNLYYGNVAVLCGVGGWPGVTADAQVDGRVRNAALGFAGATQDLPTYTQGGGELLVFALPGQDQTGGASK